MRAAANKRAFLRSEHEREQLFAAVFASGAASRAARAASSRSSTRSGASSGGSSGAIRPSSNASASKRSKPSARDMAADSSRKKLEVTSFAGLADGRGGNSPRPALIGGVEPPTKTDAGGSSSDGGGGGGLVRKLSRALVRPWADSSRRGSERTTGRSVDALASCVVAVLFKSPAAKSPAGAAAPAPAGRRWYAAGATPLYFLNFFVHGCLAAFVESFLLLYVASRYPDAPSWFLGLLVLVAALCECPVFFYAQRLLDRFGVRRLLVFAQGLFALRCAAYAFLPGCVDDERGFWYFLLLEPSHAVTFALMWSAAVEYARTAAPVERQGGAQALLRGVYYYIGVGAGSWVGGRIVKARGFHALYVAGAVGMAAWMAAWALLLRAWRPRPAAAALAPAEASTEVF